MRRYFLLAMLLMASPSLAQLAPALPAQTTVTDCGCAGNPQCLALCGGGIGSGGGNGGIGTQSKGGLGSLLGSGGIGMHKVDPNVLQGLKQER